MATMALFTPEAARKLVEAARRNSRVPQHRKSGTFEARAPRRAAGGGVQLVRLKNPTGSAGDDTSECAFHYDIYQADNTTLIAADIAMLGHGRRNPLGTMIPGTVGFAEQVGGTWNLGFADELPEMDDCDTQSSDAFSF